jgi:methylenetetrahydrofolate reductase (NADPH)
MNEFSAALDSGRFVVTGELNPPKGTDLAGLEASAQLLKDWLDAVNLTDSYTARMTMSPLAPALRVRDIGVTPILQVTGRDRNRIAIQADLLSAYALGLDNVVCMSGDDPAAGDHPDAKAVFDLGAIALLEAVSALNGGRDLSGNALSGSTDFCAGAVANPGADDLPKEIERLGEKVAAGARFIQTQPVYDLADFEPFIQASANLNVHILAGIIPLKSVAMARHLNDNVPGIKVPDAIIRQLDAADDLVATSLEIAAETINALRNVCVGVHIMAIGWNQHIPTILQMAGVPAPDRG